MKLDNDCRFKVFFGYPHHPFTVEQVNMGGDLGGDFVGLP
jgi:hypothetical protein